MNLLFACTPVGVSFRYNKHVNNQNFQNDFVHYHLGSGTAQEATIWLALTPQYPIAFIRVD